MIKIASEQCVPRKKIYNKIKCPLLEYALKKYL